MDLNQHLQMKRREMIVPDEEKILETVEKSREVYYLQSQGSLLSYGEFLWTQLQYTRKRWWALQCGLLLFAYQLLPEFQDTRARSVGVIGCLFVILAIPELWRNKSSDSMQIEAACLYSLQQIYAARMTLFGIVDIFLLTVFCFGLNQTLGLSAVQLMSQLLLPVTVTAAICFWVFSNLSEVAALWTCLTWGAAWWMILMNERVYTALFSGMWAVLFGVATLLLGLGVRRMLHHTNRYWEVTFHEITIG